MKKLSRTKLLELAVAQLVKLHELRRQLDADGYRLRPDEAAAIDKAVKAAKELL